MAPPVPGIHVPFKRIMPSVGLAVCRLRGAGRFQTGRDHSGRF